MNPNPRITRLITTIRRTRRLITELTTLLIAVAGLAGVILSLTR